MSSSHQPRLLGNLPSEDEGMKEEKMTYLEFWQKLSDAHARNSEGFYDFETALENYLRENTEARIGVMVDDDVFIYGVSRIGASVDPTPFYTRDGISFRFLNMPKGPTPELVRELVETFTRGNPHWKRLLRLHKERKRLNHALDALQAAIEKGFQTLLNKPMKVSIGPYGGEVYPPVDESDEVYYLDLTPEGTLSVSSLLERDPFLRTVDEAARRLFAEPAPPDLLGLLDGI